MIIGVGHFTIFFPCSIASKYLTSFTFLKIWINSSNIDKMTKSTWSHPGPLEQTS